MSFRIHSQEPAPMHSNYQHHPQQVVKQAATAPSVAVKLVEAEVKPAEKKSSCVYGSSIRSHPFL